MTLYKFWGVICIGALFFGLVTLANADPPTPNNTLPPGKGNTGPAQTQEGKVMFDPDTATSATHLDLTEKIYQKPGALPNDLTGQDVGAADLEFIKYENFEDAFPNDWEFYDDNGPTGGEQLWTDIPCNARTGFWSGWPAGVDGANGVNPCFPDFALYPNDVNSWLIYGPFSLVDAQSASFNIFLKMVTELCNPLTACDYLFWGASPDGVNFGGTFAAGTLTGTQGNNYDFISLDLANVPFQGNLLGQPQVWVAIQFKSDFSDTFAGPFIDDVSVTFEPAAILRQVFIPMVIKSPPLVIPKTNLYVFNNTGGLLNYYRVFGSKFDGQTIPDITCTNIPAGATQFCGTLDTNTYLLKFQGIKCTLQASRALAPGDHTREARCPS
jgi:hypothetical protein